MLNETFTDLPKNKVYRIFFSVTKSAHVTHDKFVAQALDTKGSVLMEKLVLDSFLLNRSRQIQSGLKIVVP